MKLVFLPGMDGTGRLFAPELLSAIPFESAVIALPETGNQNYVALTNEVAGRLPDTDFDVIAIKCVHCSLAAARSISSIRVCRASGTPSRAAAFNRERNLSVFCSTPLPTAYIRLKLYMASPWP